MNSKLVITDRFPKHLFWDVDCNKLSIECDKDLIIPRLLFATTEESFDFDIEKLEQLYSQADILTCLKSTKEMISNDVCRLVANRYNVPVFRRFML